MPRKSFLPPLAMTALMLALAAVPIAAADCTDGLDERCTYPDPSSGPIRPGGPVECESLNPGPFAPGTVPSTQWYAKALAYATCLDADGWENILLAHGGDVAWAAGSGVAALLDLFGGSEPFEELAADGTAVALSEAHDGCSAALSPEFEPCGQDEAVQDQACPNGLAVPNPFGPGGLAGDALDNSDGALQAACQFALSVGGSVPDPMDVVGVLMDTEAAVVTEASQAAGPIQAQATTATFAFLSSAQAATCMYLFNMNPCI